MRTKASGKSGFTLVELIVILVVIAILRAIAIPNYIKARNTKRRNSCIGNFKFMESAKRSWSVESKQLSTAIPADSDIFGGTLYIRAMPLCALGGTYSLNAVSTKPMCSKSAAPDFHTY